MCCAQLNLKQGSQLLLWLCHPNPPCWHSYRGMLPNAVHEHGFLPPALVLRALPCIWMFTDLMHPLRLCLQGPQPRHPYEDMEFPPANPKSLTLQKTFRVRCSGWVVWVDVSCVGQQQAGTYQWV
jgi:hypothetical protein